MKHDLEALDKGYDSLNYFYCTYVTGSLNLEVFAFKSNPKNVTSNKAVRNKICLHISKWSS